MSDVNGNRGVFSLLAVATTVLIGCSGPEQTEATPPAESTTAKSVSQALTIDVGNHGIGYDFYASPSFIPHGVAGDERVVFVTQPLNGQISVVDRVSGNELAVLPPPPGGWKLPFTMRVPRTGRLVVLDPGGFPSPTVPSFAHLYEYDYSYTPRTHTFTASVTRTIDFTGLPIVFTEDFEVLPAGGYVVSESIIGALWYVSPTGAIAPAVFPNFAGGSPSIPALAPCGFTPISINGVPFIPPGNVAPGVGTLAIRNNQLYFGSSCTGGVSRIPVASLTDPTRAPWDRAADIAIVTARPIGVVEETIKGLAFNKWDCDDNWLYGADAFQGRIIRINTVTGARQTVVSGSNLFDFPTGMAFLPPVAGITPLIVAADQEYRLAALNTGISSDLLHPPFIVSKVYVVH